MIDIDVVATGSSGNCTILYDGYGYLMLDCGVTTKNIRKSRNRLKFSQFDGILVTHEHGDHCDGVKSFDKIGVETICSLGTYKAMKYTPVFWTPIAHNEIKETEHYRIKAFNVSHDVAEPLGFLIQSKATNESVLYVTDSIDITISFKNVTHYLVECNYMSEIIENNDLPEVVLKRIVKNHMEIGTLERYLNRCDLSNTKSISLMHMSNGNCNEVEAIQRIQKITGIPTYVR